MRAKRTIWSFLGVVICLLVSTEVGQACSCELPPVGLTPKRAVSQARDKSRAVFSGKVVDVVQNSEVSYVEVRFKVETSWKGNRSEDLIIRTGSRGGSCGFHFEVGQRYLVYAYGSDETKLETNICQRTRLLRNAAEDLRLLGNGRVVSKNLKT